MSEGGGTATAILPAEVYRDVWWDRRSNKIHLWGTDADGRRFHERIDHNHHYYMVVPEGKQNCPQRTIDGKPLFRTTLAKGENVRTAIANHRAANTTLCEISTSPETKFLHDRYHGLQPDQFKFSNTFRMCSMDIEVQTNDLEFPDEERTQEPILLITFTASHTGQIHVITAKDFDTTIPEFAPFLSSMVIHRVETERELIEKFFELYRKNEFDILTGWNIEDYDIPYILNRYAMILPAEERAEILWENEYTSEWSVPITKIGKVIFSKKKKDHKWRIPGTQIMDYLSVFKRYTYEMLSSYSLENVAQHVLGHGKMKYKGSMAEFSRNEWDRFVAYNIVDVVLVDKIDAATKFLDMAAMFSVMANVRLEEAFYPMLLITGILQGELHSVNQVLPEPKKYGEDSKLKGGYVMANPGRYKHLLSYDFESLYPYMVMLFNISPETKVTGISLEEAKARNLIISPVKGVYYKRETGIIPKVVRKVYLERKYWKDVYKKRSKELGEDHPDTVFANNQQLIRKIFINSCYGVLGSEYFAFFDLDNASVITAGGRSVIQWCGNAINRRLRSLKGADLAAMIPGWDFSTYNGNHEDAVVLTDTDSNYVSIDELWEKVKSHVEVVDDSVFLRFARDFDDNFLAPFFRQANDRWCAQWGVENILNFKREKVIKQQIVVAKKKYIALTLEKEGKVYDKPKLDVTGMEFRRSDSSQFVRANMKDLVMDIMNTDNEHLINAKLYDLWQDFRKSPPSVIGGNTNVRKIDKYLSGASAAVVQEIEDEYVDMEFAKGTPQHIKAAITFNDIANRARLGIPPITARSLDKMCYLYVKPDNVYSTSCIGFIGDWPEQFDGMFQPDYKTQFDKTFLPTVERIYKAVGWSKPTPNKVALKFFGGRK